MIKHFPFPADAGHLPVLARSPITTAAPHESRQRLAFTLAVILLALAPGVALAQQPRLDASRLSCAALQDALNEAGSAIVRSRSRYSGGMLSDRFVARVELCFGTNQTLRSAEVVAADTRSCWITRCGRRQRGGRR